MDGKKLEDIWEVHKDKNQSVKEGKAIGRIWER